MLVLESTDPNIERVTAFSRGPTYLAGYREVIGRKGNTAAQPILDSFFRKPKTQ
jgi:hypothetical protein